MKAQVWPSVRAHSRPARRQAFRLGQRLRGTERNGRRGNGEARGMLGNDGIDGRGARHSASAAILGSRVHPD
ncbi:hypothetical protein thsps117_15090 [Pseudomonas sp. No.117]